MLICFDVNRSFCVSEIEVFGPTEAETWLLGLSSKRNTYKIEFDDKGECLYMRDLLARCMDPKAGVVVYPFSLMDDMRFLREET